MEDALQSVLYRDPQTRDRLREAEIRMLWREQNPPLITTATGRILFARGVLRIEIKNAALRSDLALRRDALRKRINQILQQEVVYQLYFM